jgi:hypothetical protein
MLSNCCRSGQPTPLWPHSSCQRHQRCVCHGRHSLPGAVGARHAHQQTPHGSHTGGLLSIHILLTEAQYFQRRAGGLPGTPLSHLC